ncbi:hypothetical protein B7494_g2176 [Chlorociboria aeruginascens]|nr:hypothetical protein B7494_g2176 [Chlorociboria aeruginascens]
MPHSIQDSEDSRGYIPNKSHNGPSQRKPTLSPEGTPSSESDDQDDDAYIDEDASTSSGGLPDEALDEEQDEIKQSSSSGLDDLELHRRNRMKQAWQIYYQVFTQLRRHAEKQKFLRKKKQPGQNDPPWNLTKRPSGKRLARLKLTRCMEILAESQELYGDSVQRSAGNHNLDIHTPSTQPDRPSRDAVSNIEVPLDTDRAHTFSRYESEIPSASDHKVPIHRQNLDARKRTSTSRVSPGNKLSGSRRTRIPWPRQQF